MKRMVRVPIDQAVSAQVYNILTLLGFECEITYDYREMEMYIEVYEGGQYYGKINTIRDFD